MAGLSRAMQVASLPRDQRETLYRSLSPDAIRALRWSWEFWARGDQLPPGTPGADSDRDDWAFWLLMGGRGSGKTRAGSEFSNRMARELPRSHGALVAPTADDARKTMLSAGLDHIPGQSGILAISPPGFRPVYEPSKRTLTWPNGTTATIYSAEEPDRLRGPQHHWGWCDEVAAWADHGEAWDQFLFGLRLGDRPRACVTTTPRPIPLLKKLLADPHTVVSRARTLDNAASLSPVFLSTIVDRFKNTRLGRQELDGELIEDAEGALWRRVDMIDRYRVERAPTLRRIVIPIDPATTNNPGSDETGIVPVGVGPCRCKGVEEEHAFVLEDLSGRVDSDTWAKRAVLAYHRLQADRIIAEVNNGGDLVERVIRIEDATVSYAAVRAAKGKFTRAEPVAALYQQGKVHHVGVHPELEDQLCGWDPRSGAKSPDRLDALVWGVTYLLLPEPTKSDGYFVGELSDASIMD